LKRGGGQDGGGVMGLDGQRLDIGKIPEGYRRHIIFRLFAKT